MGALLRYIDGRQHIEWVSRQLEVPACHAHPIRLQIVTAAEALSHLHSHDVSYDDIREPSIIICTFWTSGALSYAFH
jgi:hypothetical protein